MQLAPIILFVYNRPWHTEQTLKALQQNDLADQSVLYIYADGPKANTSVEENQNISAVRKLIRSQQWCKEVTIIESEKNKGLADSIVDGVTSIVNQYGTVIVLEDDIVTSKGFLQYMNDALKLYENEENVFHISGYMFPVKGHLPETFFYRQTSCWGWATWSDKWKYFEHSAEKLWQKLNTTGLINAADIDGTNQFIRQLKDNLNKKIKTWAVFWHFTVFLQNGLCLHPSKTLVQNIGMDGSGTNCGVDNTFNALMATHTNVNKIEVIDYSAVYPMLKLFYESQGLLPPITDKRKKLKDFVPPKIKHRVKLLLNKNFRKYQKEKKVKINLELSEKRRLNDLPRFTETEVVFEGKFLKIVDVPSFNFLKAEIFDEQIYRFETVTETPYIIDCGANIGLSIIYFKKLYPNAKVVAFEPDDKIFSVLQNNVEKFKISDVTLVKKALWDEETTLRFYSEGADGGRAAKDFDTTNIIEVPTTRLINYLDKKVDFLKIDIEGAEFTVLDDVKNSLENVDRIFVEFHSFSGKEQMLPEIITILKHAGFRLHISSPGLMSKQPFIQINEYANMDNQLNIYGRRF